MIYSFKQIALPLALSGVVLSTFGCTRVSRSDEIRLGRQTATAVERQYRTYTDPAVSRIGQSLADASERPELPWSFKVIDSNEVNAISLPGGPIYIFEGLLRRIGNDEGMLAGVLGHEVGHVEKRHAARQIERQQAYGLGAAVLDQAAGGDAGAVAQVAANLQLLSYSRQQEYAADDASIRLMRATGRDPEGLVRLLELLRQLGGDSQSIGWMRTHPTSQARVNRARERIAQTR